MTARLIHSTYNVDKWCSPFNTLIGSSFIRLPSRILKNVFGLMSCEDQYWVDEWMNGWVIGWINGWVTGCIDGWANGWMDGWVDGWMIYVCTVPVYRCFSDTYKYFNDVNPLNASFEISSIWLLERILYQIK